MHFQTFCQAPYENHIGRYFKVICNYPSYFTQEESRKVSGHVSLEEVKNILSGFAKEKSYGHDG